MDNKLTDNEIIKALSTVAYGGYSCDKCKYKIKDGEERCGIKGCNITRNALNLINRQYAEIEGLQLEVEAVNGLINPLPFKSNFDRAIETAKFEAVKEFVLKLKIYILSHCCVTGDEVDGIWKYIDHLVKEMGADNEKDY